MHNFHSFIGKKKLFDRVRFHGWFFNDFSFCQEQAFKEADIRVRTRVFTSKISCKISYNFQVLILVFPLTSRGCLMPHFLSAKYDALYVTYVRGATYGGRCFIEV